MRDMEPEVAQQPKRYRWHILFKLCGQLLTWKASLDRDQEYGAMDIDWVAGVQRLETFQAETYQLREANLNLCSARSMSVSQYNLHLFPSARVQECSGGITVLDLHLCVAEESLASPGSGHV
ncbi:MAG: hypothetical protein FRX49_03549 [Trebouxia sp. A1-2]|nr:MAG: hypothetical protein FRX49_03549 [Trebouxia sp. A1-2]